MTTQLMEDVLPMDDPLNAFTIRSHVLGVAERLEKELGNEHQCFIEGCPRDWAKLPAPARSRWVLMVVMCAAYASKEISK